MDEEVGDGALVRGRRIRIEDDGNDFEEVVFLEQKGRHVGDRVSGCGGPSLPCGLRRGSLRCSSGRLACRAEACEASEGWWARQGSNL
jgi:hypothetical protein